MSLPIPDKPEVITNKSDKLRKNSNAKDSVFLFSSRPDGVLCYVVLRRGPGLASWEPHGCAI